MGGNVSQAFLARKVEKLRAEFSTEGTDTPGGRWTRLELWQRNDGTMRCVKVRGSRVGEPEVQEAVLSDYPAAKLFFGRGWVAEEIYRIAENRYPKPKQSALTPGFGGP